MLSGDGIKCHSYMRRSVELPDDKRRGTTTVLEIETG